jgi:long-chain acyl-CoA synthetase
MEHPKVQSLYANEVARCTAGRARFEQIKTFRLLARDFSLEEGELTPTLKIRRNVVEKKHHALIQSIYPDPVSG